MNIAHANRGRPIIFEFQNRQAVVDDQWKLYRGDRGARFELYDLLENPAEAHNLAEAHPEVF